MKCPECDGTGKVVHPMMSMNGDEYTGEWEQHECEACNGTGEVEMTEQKWLQTCNTEQLADKLTDFSFWLVPTIPTEDKREQIRKRIVEWLKEIHDEM